MNDGPVKRVTSWLEGQPYFRSGRVVALSPGMADGVAATGDDRRNIFVIPNCCDLALFDPGARSHGAFRKKHPEIGGRQMMLYAGTLGRVNGVSYFVRLAEMVCKSRKDICFVVIGGSAEEEKVRAVAEAAGLLGRSFFMYPPIAKTEMPVALTDANVAFSLFIDLKPVWRNSANKFFDELASVTPVAINYGGWQAETLDEYGAALEMMYKRVFDILVSGGALLVLSPVIVILFVLVRRDLGSPALFRQKRPGLRGRSFTMVKFRSMNDALGESGNLLDDVDRVTRLGRFLRSSSLDELPELWNVFIGDMSLVGPRPLLMEYLPLYSEAQARRHEVKPGLTGWAQVNGRNRLTWDEKFALDVEYVEKRNFWFDLKILFLTVWKVIQSDGIDEEGVVGQTPFRGNDERGRS